MSPRSCLRSLRLLVFAVFSAAASNWLYSVSSTATTQQCGCCFCEAINIWGPRTSLQRMKAALQPHPGQSPPPLTVVQGEQARRPCPGRPHFPPPAPRAGPEGLSLDPDRSWQPGPGLGQVGSQRPGRGPGRGLCITFHPHRPLPRYLAKLSSVGSISEEETCEKLKGLIQRQVQMCKRNLEVMDSVRRGAQLAIEECQYQFRNRRWNCSTLDSLPVFGKVVTQAEKGLRDLPTLGCGISGTREAAFVYAISSAGVAFAVTRACSSGELEKCGCDRTVHGASSGQDARTTSAYGVAFSQSFVDVRERSKGASSSRALMNLHNNEAGRKAILTHMRVECKCHGVSGSCEVKTCWRAVPPFRQVGHALKEKFDGATEVEPRRVGSSRALVPRNAQFKPHTDEDLVYLEPSPDFCEQDMRSGVLGTRGRTCNKTSKAIDGCELLCCGRGFHTAQVELAERCSCKFHWCCFVKCRQCQRLVELHTCR
ncbi:hypothetical protein QTO34_018967 [Cnephaeus nilssonii]|uniref:Protein Wnt n=2 Tax=Boreoeutheria TaxID=1437010 RepID=A0AA40HZS1_CNENI|nr:hypothetical protein QTO34_018967 [Eptesicus nilssonii]